MAWFCFCRTVILRVADLPLWISFILTNFGSSVFPPFYLSLSPPTGDASEKPGCSQFADSGCRLLSGALGG